MARNTECFWLCVQPPPGVGSHGYPFLGPLQENLTTLWLGLMYWTKSCFVQLIVSTKLKGAIPLPSLPVIEICISSAAKKHGNECRGADVFQYLVVLQEPARSPKYLAGFACFLSVVIWLVHCHRVVSRQRQ